MIAFAATHTGELAHAQLAPAPRQTPVDRPSSLPLALTIALAALAFVRIELCARRWLSRQDRP